MLGLFSTILTSLVTILSLVIVQFPRFCILLLLWFLSEELCLNSPGEGMETLITLPLPLWQTSLCAWIRFSQEVVCQHLGGLGGAVRCMELSSCLLVQQHGIDWSVQAATHTLLSELQL